MSAKSTKPFNKYFDHTLLRADAARDEILELVAQAARYDFAAVCVNGCHVKTAAEEANRICAAEEASRISASVHGTPQIKVAAVVGFPLGASSTAAKAFETEDAIRNGAGEIDMVINVGAAKEGRWDLVREEITKLARICHGNDDIRVTLKVIIETCLLTDNEIIKACETARDAGADFVKTSTGFSTGGATAAHVALMKKAAGPDVSVKASGGIRTLSDAKAMIEAGADRLGCSASVEIMEEYLSSKEQL